MLSFVGGVQSTSVAEVAENIRNMLGQYKKIAIIDFSPTTSVKLNINFNPTKFIIILKNIRNGDCVAIDSNLGFKLTLVNLRVDIKSTDIKYNNDTKVLTLDPERFNLYDFVMERVIAIEQEGDSMSLIQEINRTGTETNKTKQVATNIDNKLVELGGERATDLADVPNKINTMVFTQYKKFATGDLNYKTSLGPRQGFNKTLPVDFKIKNLFLIATSPVYSSEFTGMISTLGNTEPVNWYMGTVQGEGGTISIKMIDNNTFRIQEIKGKSMGTLIYGKWFALG